MDSTNVTHIVLPAVIRRIMLSTRLTNTLPAVIRINLRSPAVYPAMGHMARDYARRFSTAVKPMQTATTVADADATPTTTSHSHPLFNSFFHDLDNLIPKPYFFSSPFDNSDSQSPLSMWKDLKWIDDARRKNYFPITKVDVTSDDNKHVLSLDLPGVGIDGVKVEVKDDKTLHIYGGRKLEESATPTTKEGKGDETRKMQGEVKFDRQWRLDDTVDVKNIIANMKDGVLRVTLPIIPKAQLPTENIRQIKID